MIILFLCSCSTSNITVKENNKLHSAVETDIFKLTLDNAKLSIALDTYGAPVDLDDYHYYTAAKGHTFVSYSFTIENMDRVSQSLDTSSYSFVTVKYNNSEYTENSKFAGKANNKFNWEPYWKPTISLNTNSSMMFCGYMDIPVEAQNLNDDFDITFSLPNAKGEKENFTFSVTEFDRNNYIEPETPLNLAVAYFDYDECQQVVANHINEYTVATGEEIRGFLTKQTRKTIYKTDQSGKVQQKFQQDGRIFEFYYDTGEYFGYLNNRTWQIEGDKLILTSNFENNFKSYTCTGYKVGDLGYYFVSEDLPAVIMMR